MTTIEQKEFDLQEQLKALQQQKLQEAEQERANQLDYLAQLKDNANAYRTNAERATDDDEKKRLYLFADEAETAAAEISKQLGLVAPEIVESSVERIENERRAMITGRVADLLRKGLFLLVAFGISDYLAGYIEPGFFSYALHTVAQFAYTPALVFVGLWLSVISIWPFVSGYVVKRLGADADKCTPAQRLYLLLGVAFIVVYLIAQILPNGN